MPETFELYLLPIIRKEGREQNLITGLFAATAPRRSQRSRTQDRLFLWMTMVIGHSLVNEETMQKVTKDAATLYYSTKGTVTSGLNAAANHINDAMRVIGGGEPVGAKLNMAVLRGDTLYMAHAGAVFTFLMRGDHVEAFFSSLSEKQLPGYVSEIQPQFFTTKVQMGDAFLFTPQPAQEWEREVLQFGDELALPNVRRRLLDQTKGDFSAILMHLKPGKKGVFHRLRPAGAAPVPSEQADEQPAQSPQPHAPVQKPVPQTHVEESQPQSVSEPEVSEAVFDETLNSELPEYEPAVYEPAVYEPEVYEPEVYEPEADESSLEEQYSASTPPQVLTAQHTQDQSQGEKAHKDKPDRPPLIEQLPIPNFKKWGVSLAAFWVKLRKLDVNAPDEMPFDPEIEEDEDGSEAKPVKDKKPSALEGFKLPISNQILLGIAVIVPLLISVIAATVYSQRGVQQQYDTYITLADQVLNEALNEQEAIVRQAKLDEALSFLDQAEEYKITTVSKALRTQLLEVMEDTGEISRVEIFDALGLRLNKNINFTRLVTNSDNDLFALDGNSGQVLYFRYTDAQYEYDSTFKCGGSGLQKVVDVAALTPFNAMDASIITISETGNLNYCQPGAEPRSVNLNVPLYGWGAVVDMDVERDLLFIIDTGTRSVWSYYGPQQDFSDSEARLFFPHDPPVDLAEVAGLDVFSDTMVFLSEDNQITTCLVQSLDAEYRECIDLPPRDSSEMALTLKDLDWVDFFPADYPPAFYLMDASSKTLYRFSYKMIINRAYRFLPVENESLPDKGITAFTITDNQLVIVAYENELYIGQLKIQ